MKVTSAKAKALLAQLNTTGVGQSIELPPFMPGLSPETIKAFIVEKEDSHWTLECRWHGINIGDVQVSVNKGTLSLEVI